MNFLTFLAFLAGFSLTLCAGQVIQPKAQDIDSQEQDIEPMGIVTSKNFKARLNSGHYYGMLLENGFLVARESVPSALTLEISQEGVLFQGNLVAHAKSDGTFHFTHGAADASGRWSIKGLLLEFQSKYIFYLCIDGKISHYQSNDGCPTQMTIVGQ